MEGSPSASVGPSTLDPIGFLRSVVVGALLGFVLACALRTLSLIESCEALFASHCAPGTQQCSTAAAAPRAREGAAQKSWSFSRPLASDSEKMIIKLAVMRLGDALRPLPRHHDIEMLRHLRSFGLDSFEDETAAAERLAGAYSRALLWRRANVPHRPDAPRVVWPAAAELAEGDWAAGRYSQFGLCIGRATGGLPVKLERPGDSDTSGLMSTPGGDERLLRHYYSLLEAILNGLNAESAAAGKLLYQYEVFDAKGLSLAQIRWATPFFSRGLAAAIQAAYAETIGRVVIINVPRLAAWPARALLRLFSERLVRRTLIIGEGEPPHDFDGELDEAAVAGLRADSATLARHRGEALAGALPMGPAGSRP